MKIPVTATISPGEHYLVTGPLANIFKNLGTHPIGT
tara:strand:- start:154 stop:261 length:108 start_codon:yes stop_codon:yes gene_type:complete